MKISKVNVKEKEDEEKKEKYLKKIILKTRLKNAASIQFQMFTFIISIMFVLWAVACYYYFGLFSACYCHPQHNTPTNLKKYILTNPFLLGRSVNIIQNAI